MVLGVISEGAWLSVISNRWCGVGFAASNRASKEKIYISVGFRRYLVPMDLTCEMWDIREICGTRGA